MFKQSTVIDSTTEAKYIALLDAVTKTIWMKKFITKLRVVPNIVDPIKLYYDNKAKDMFTNSLNIFLVGFI